MKKILKAVFVTALCIMFLFVFGACSSKPKPSEEPINQSDTPVQSTVPQEITDIVVELPSGEEIELVDSAAATADSSAETTDSSAAATDSDAAATDSDAAAEPVDGAAEPVLTNEPAVTQQFSGTVKEITEEDGNYSFTLSVWDGTNESEIIASCDDTTAIVNAIDGEPVKPSDIPEGDPVIAYLSTMTTRSIPPIAHAYCIISGLPADSAPVPTYIEVSEVNITDGGDLVVLNQNKDLYVTIPKSVKIGISGEAGEVVPFDRITEGTKLLAWYEAVMESYPAQATAQQCVTIVIGLG